MAQPNEIELVSRGRRDTMEHVGLESGDTFEEAKEDIKTFWTDTMQFWEEYWIAAKPRLLYRLWWAVVLSVVMTLILYGQPDNLQKITGASRFVPTRNWYRFIGTVIGINFIATAVDIWFFMIIDLYFNGPHTYRIRTDFFRGSLATVSTVYFVDAFRNEFLVPRSFDNWGDIMAMLITITMCYIVKQYYQRLSYSKFVVTRYSETIKRMDVNSVILSRLACWKPTSHPINYQNADAAAAQNNPAPAPSRAQVAQPARQRSNRDLHSSKKRTDSDAEASHSTAATERNVKLFDFRGALGIGITRPHRGISEESVNSTGTGMGSGQKGARSRNDSGSYDAKMQQQRKQAYDEAMSLMNEPEELVTRVPFGAASRANSIITTPGESPSGSRKPSIVSQVASPQLDDTPKTRPRKRASSGAPLRISVDDSMVRPPRPPTSNAVTSGTPTSRDAAGTDSVGNRTSPSLPRPFRSSKKSDADATENSSDGGNQGSLNLSNEATPNTSINASAEVLPRSRNNAMHELPIFRLLAHDDNALANGTVMTAAGEVDATINIRQFNTMKIKSLFDDTDLNRPKSADLAAEVNASKSSGSNSNGNSFNSSLRIPAFRRGSAAAIEGVGAAGKEVTRLLSSFAGSALAPRAKSPAEELEFLSSPADIFADFIDDDDVAQTTATAGETKSKSAQHLINLTLLTKSFWRKLQVAGSGEMRLSTVNGIVVIRNSKQAKAFGKKLYFHMRHGNFAGIKQLGAKIKTADETGEGAAAASTQVNIPQTSQLNGSILVSILHAMRSATRYHPLTPQGAYTSHDGSNMEDSEEDIDIEWMTKACCEMFHCSNDTSSVITEEQVVDTCYVLFKDYKNLSLSLEDNNRLRKSIDHVVDIAFWMLMLVAAQLLLHIDPLLIITPMLSIILLLSFALGSVLGNMFLGIGFVIFILPYDVGDRVAIGAGSNKIIGNVVSVELLHTTFLTIYNEKMMIPNHLLFGEKILNLQQSRNATLEIPVSFALAGPGAAPMDKILEFWSIMDKWMATDQKNNWKETFVSLHTINAVRNQLGYSYWVTSRYTFAQTTKLFTSRRIMIEKMTEVQRQVGISFMDVAAPVEIYDSTTSLPPSKAGSMGEPKPDNTAAAQAAASASASAAPAASMEPAASAFQTGLQNRFPGARAAESASASASSLPKTDSFGNFLSGTRS